jgi:hypothetical protein
VRLAKKHGVQLRQSYRGRLRLVLAQTWTVDRLFKLPALVLDFVEQPHILDGDCSLVGEGLARAREIIEEFAVGFRLSPVVVADAALQLAFGHRRT